jgi:hypothetical protein
MNLPNHDDTKTTIGVPATRAVIGELKAIGGFRMEIRFQDETKPNSKQKPYGYNGCLIYYTTGAEKPTITRYYKNKNHDAHPVCIATRTGSRRKIFHLRVRLAERDGRGRPLERDTPYRGQLKTE